MKFERERGRSEVAHGQNYDVNGTDSREDEYKARISRLASLSAIRSNYFNCVISDADSSIFVLSVPFSH